MPPGRRTVLQTGFIYGVIASVIIVVITVLRVENLLKEVLALFIGGGLFVVGLSKATAQSCFTCYIGSSMSGLSCGLLFGLAFYGKLRPILAGVVSIPLIFGLLLTIYDPSRK